MKKKQTLSQTPFDITVRKNLDWDFSEVEAKFVDHPSMLVSFLWAGLSAGATPIESFFIKTLLPTLETISGDEKLEQDVRNMIAQEAQHSANHRILNTHLKSKGYDLDTMQAFFKEQVKTATAGLTEKDMLGVVAFGEHALYSFAHVYLNSPELRKAFHPQAERLFFYHFIEEAEHGAVSHDQYRYFYGNDYKHRVKTAIKSLPLLTMLSKGTKVTAKGFGHKITLKDRAQLNWYLWVNPGPMRGLSLRMLEYLSPWYDLGFSHEDLDQIAEWDNELLYEHQAAPKNAKAKAKARDE
jgi:predicted metal-dependent hydrolase